MTRREREEKGAFRWVDVSGPSREELMELAKEFLLPQDFVIDCLEPEHLPKYAALGDAHFLILRTDDPTAGNKAVSVQQMTRKIALFVRGDLILSIHRAELPCLQTVWEGRFTSIQELFFRLCLATIVSLDRTLELTEKDLEVIEAREKMANIPPRTLFQLHLLRRRLTNFKRLMWHTNSVLSRIPIAKESASLLYQEVREEVESLLFFADELLEDATSLIHLHLSMASHRTNEIIRLLTVFSVFFMPLTFIVGVYGMNFVHMPELGWKYGYAFAWGAMLLVTGGIAIWFKRSKVL